MSPQITITKLDESDPAAIYRHYPAEHRPQDCFIALDLADGTLSADHNAEIGNSVPMSVWHGRTRRYPIPHLTAKAANALLEEIAPLAQRVLDGAELVWDGNNHVAHLDSDADQAESEILERCDPNGWHWDPVEQIEEIDAHHWWQDALDRAELAREYGITADTTDARLTEIAKQAAQDARTTGNSGYTIVTGVQALLDDLRFEMRERVDDQLGEVAERIRAATEQRNQLVRQMAGWGDDRYSHRGIAATAGLSHTHIGNIVRKADTVQED